MNRRYFAATLATALTTAIAVSPALAQNQRSDDKSARDGKQAQKGHHAQNGHHAKDLDAKLAEALAFGNQAEIAVSELAKDRVQTPQLRDFAQMMVDEHTKVLNKLEQFAPEVTDIRTYNVQDSGRRQTAAYRGRNQGEGQEQGQRQGQGQGQAQAQASNPMEQIWTEAAARCLNMTLKDMKAQEGLDFDWAYVSQQWGAHTKMLSELEAMQGHGSQDFNKIVENGIAATKKHLEKLDSLMKTLERKES